MGFSRVLIPRRNGNKKSKWKKSPYKTNTVIGIDRTEVYNLKDAIDKGLTQKLPQRNARKKKDSQKINSFEFVENSKVPLDDFIIDDDDDDDDDNYSFQ